MTCTDNSTERLNINEAMRILSSVGPFATTLKGFESRQEQQAMMHNVLEAYNQSHVVLIEAGTGTGKSLAYLIPAMLWAAQAKERTVISTNTIALQQQLLSKDIPLIKKTLGLDLKAVIAKGMQNYLCLRKYEETAEERLLLSPQENEELLHIEGWKANTADGSRSSLPQAVSHTLWEKICADNDTCNRNSCPYYQKCHFFNARRQAAEAQILIVNHHLLFADLVFRAENDNYTDAGILPPYNRIILDEAHHIEDIATEYFASRISQLDLIRLIARITSEKGTKLHGKLPLLKQKISEHYRNELPRHVSSIHARLTIDLPGTRKDLLQQAHQTFGAFFEFVQAIQNHSSDDSHQGESKLRLLQHHQTLLRWNQQLLPYSKQLIDGIQKFAQGLKAIVADIKNLKNPTLDEQLKSLLFEINALTVRFGNYAAIINNFISENIPTNKVRWIELQPLKSMINTSLVDAELDIAKTLANFLFSKFSTIVLCSATLTTNNQFHFIRSRLGLTSEHLPQKTINEYTYPSPFNFMQQALLLIPTDIPDPNHPSFVAVAAEKIWQALLASRGNAFVLFTSYKMLQTCFGILKERLDKEKFQLLKQGDDDRQTLLNKFKEVNHSVLFGTDSFWEGVDVVGDALRCVIIVKLPFKVPSDPIIQARSESITARGGDAFMEYSLPQAIVKFKQGFGRLIRNKRDRGCIICLDNRITTKRYGKLILNSLPECQCAFVKGEELENKMTAFYKDTNYLSLN